MGFLSHNSGSRHARKSIKGSKDVDNGQRFIVSYDSDNKQDHYKKPLDLANQPQ